MGVLLLPAVHKQCNIARNHCSPRLLEDRRIGTNSTSALMKADSIGVYGSEVDIRFRRSLKTMMRQSPSTGNNCVWKRPRSTSTAGKAFQRRAAANREYSDAFEKCKKTKLIIEFKPHEKKERRSGAGAKVIEMVHAARLQDKVESISGHPLSALLVRQIDPQ